MSPCDKSMLKVTTYFGVGSCMSIVYNPLYPENTWFGHKTWHLVQISYGKLRPAIFRVYQDGTGKPSITVDAPLLSSWWPMYAGGVESWPGRCQVLPGLPPPDNKWRDQSRPGRYHTCYPELVKTDLQNICRGLRSLWTTLLRRIASSSVPEGNRLRSDDFR